MSRQRNVIDVGLALVYGILAALCLPMVVTAATAAPVMVAPLVVSAGLCLIFGRLAIKRWKSSAKGLQSESAQTDAEPRDLQPGEFFTRVVGSSHANSDGSDRQESIRKYCTPGAPLTMAREPHNSFDSNAIAVRCGGTQIGYLTGEIAEKFAADVDSGKLVLSGRVTNITGGTQDKPTLGVNIVLTRTQNP